MAEYDDASMLDATEEPKARRVIGWVRTKKSGLCVNPKRERPDLVDDPGAHMTDGGYTNVRRQDEESPPVMCQECWDWVRSLGPDDAPKN